MLSLSPVRLALGALALTACAETQAPVDAPIQPGIASTLPILKSAKTDLESRHLDPDHFNITLRFVNPPTDHLRRLFRTSARRWQEIIVGDVPAITGAFPRNTCGPFGTPRFSGTIDDILIDVVLQPIDGPGNVLGRAGPCLVRTVDDLSVYGVMIFDTEDLELYDSLGLLDEIIIHEMGHVLGYGTLWSFNRELLLGVGTRNPRFVGEAAIRKWHRLGGRGRVPVEGQFGPGTANSHWDEDTFDNELMTGFLNFGKNPLSNLSALSMRALGYVALANGDPYQLPKPEEVPARSLLSGVDLRSGERLIQPKMAIE